MEVYQVRVFLEVARHLSFTEAADALNLTQPAVSAKIKSLETELGTPLFYRLGRKIQLTEVGQFLAESGATLIQAENQLLQKIEAIKQGKLGRLSIGCTAAIAASWLPDVIFKYHQQHPGIQPQCQVFDTAEQLYRAITSNQVDLGISDISFEEFAEIASTPIDTIHYAAFLATTHPLAKQNWLSLQDLKTYPWAVLPAGTPSRLLWETRLAELDLSLADFPQLAVVDTLSLMRTYMIQGNYLGFASSLDFPAHQAGGLTAVPLQEFPLSSSIFLVLPKRLRASIDLQQARRRHSLNPIQKFVALLPDRAEADPAAGMRWRSPHLLLRSYSGQRPDRITLNIGIQNGTIPAITAGLIMQRLSLLEHFLPRDGRYSSTQFQVQWRDYPTGAPIVTGLHRNELHIGILGDYPLLLSATPEGAKSAATRLVSFVSINPDGSCNAVMVPHQSPFHSIQDLRGRVIAVPFHSSAHGMVMRSLHADNLLNEVQLTTLDSPATAQRFDFSAQAADGYAHFAPFHDIACRQGALRYLPDSHRATLPAFYGVVVSGKLADQYPEVVIAYLQSLTAAQHWYNTTVAAPGLVSQWTRLETEMISQILSSAAASRSGRFVSEMSIHADWLALHIAQLSQIPGNENLAQINLNQWIQPEFLQSLS